MAAESRLRFTASEAGELPFGTPAETSATFSVQALATASETVRPENTQMSSQPDLDELISRVETAELNARLLAAKVRIMEAKERLAQLRQASISPQSPEPTRA